MTEHSIKKLQLKKLKKLLEHAKNNVPMYKELYRDLNIKINTIDDLKNLPILDSKFLKQQEILYYTTENAVKKNLILHATSGSSGEPFQFYQSKNDALKWQLTLLRMLFVNGWKPWWKVINVWRDNIVESKSLFGKLLTFKKNIVSINLPVDKQVKILLKIKPKLIYGVTPTLEIIADWMIENKNCINSARIILGMGITPSTAVAKKLNLAFGEKAKVISYYGANEVGSIGFFCSKCNLFHFEDDQILTEIVDENNNPVENGISGRILITALDRFTTPLIRYDIGDKIKLPVKYEICKINFKQFFSIEGRESDKIKLKNGNIYSYHNFYAITMHLKKVKQIQFYQKIDGDVIIKYVPYVDTDIEEIESYITDNLPFKDKIHFSFEIVENIPLEMSGKRKLIKIE